MKLPVLIVNFKTYPQTTGEDAERLALLCDRIAEETGKSIAVAVQATDIYRISGKVKIPVLAQHMDALEQGRNTGKILGEALKQAGAYGTLLNHSEDPYDAESLGAAVKKARALGLYSVVCGNNPEATKEAAKLKPDMIAVEPPELIAGKISVSEAKPEVISESVNDVNSIADIPVLCGAGVNSGEDVKKALELGAKGVLVASAICKSGEPEKVVRELVEYL